MSKLLTIVQPYVPSYRVAFFERLIDRLASQNIECLVAAPEPNGAQALRGDSARPEWVVSVRRSEIEIAGRRLVLGGSRPAWRNSDGVILGCRGTALDNYLALAQSARGRLRVGLWGHLKDYVSSGHKVDQAAERFQMRRADQVFAYVPSGAEYAESCGVSPSRITTVFNTVDEAALQSSLAALGTDAIDRFRSEWNLPGKRVFAFIGGVDESKRISFLVDSLTRLRATGTQFVVLVAGQGDQISLFDDLVASGHVILLGYTTGRTKALVLSVAEAILMPGRVGLIAVDALVARIPIITTRWPHHAPEIEYLREGASVITASDDPEGFANVLRANRRARKEIRDWDVPTLDRMVDNFTSGVVDMLMAPRADARSVSRTSARGRLAS